MLYPVVKSDKYGFINSQGEVIVEPTYDLVGRFAEDRCIVEKNDVLNLEHDRLQVYINSSGKEIIPLKPCCFCTSFSQGLAQFEVVNGKVGFIDTEGEFKISPQFEIDYEGEVSLGFSDGVAAVALEEGWTYINQEGEKILDIKFEIARRFQDGYALVSPFKQPYQTEKLFFIDKKGQRLETIPCKINILCQGFRNGLCQVILPQQEQETELNKIGFINTSGNLAFEGKFAHSSGFNEGLCIVKKFPDKFGVINTLGEWVIEPLYEEIGWFNHGIAPFRQNQQWGLLNASGEVILPPQFSFIDSFIGYLPPLDPFHNQEFRELTTATIAQPVKKNQPGKQVYINRTGAIVSSWEI
ncbi:WG repeat-containing protein [Anabaena azotica]|uniref:WG repeat-containing protein n=1 Tax=Anabaena azotica FACHB-119 TaxID=947527 RepID=A0ABR8DC64_9NOST|nr:WG repeat-containing protein [Anabaena azotica]MBD2504556.1 WG repeat-containing protein [Anabaena azotica FACHB-119]